MHHKNTSLVSGHSEWPVNTLRWNILSVIYLRHFHIEQNIFVDLFLILQVVGHTRLRLVLRHTQKHTVQTHTHLLTLSSVSAVIIMCNCLVCGCIQYIHTFNWIFQIKRFGIQLSHFYICVALCPFCVCVYNRLSHLPATWSKTGKLPNLKLKLFFQYNRVSVETCKISIFIYSSYHYIVFFFHTPYWMCCIVWGEWKNGRHMWWQLDYFCL